MSNVCGVMFFLACRTPPRSTRTYTRFPCTTLFRSGQVDQRGRAADRQAQRRRVDRPGRDEALPRFAQDRQRGEDAQHALDHRRQVLGLGVAVGMVVVDPKITRLNSSHYFASRMLSSALKKQIQTQIRESGSDD